LSAGIAYVGVESAAAHAVPGYRYAHDFISDLGRPDSPLSPLMNGAFAFQGLMFGAGAALLVRARGGGRRAFLACAAANTVGNLVVAAVPSGPAGIPWVHVTGAVLAILGGNAAILAGASTVARPRAYRTVSFGFGALGLLSSALLAVIPSAALERTSVYTIIAWQLLSAVLLLRQSDDP
jgi:hypothetical membrane protein